MHAENHSILKRCEVTFDGYNIDVGFRNIEQVLPTLSAKWAKLRKFRL